MILLGNMKTYLGTTPATFTTLPDLDLNPLVASSMQLTPQELLGLLPDGGSHSHFSVLRKSAFFLRLGPVDTNDNLSTVSEITEMAGQVAIEEKAVEEVTKEVEIEKEFQQIDTEV